MRSSAPLKPKSRRVDVDLVIVDLGARREDLQPNRVARFEAACRRPFSYLPAGLPAVVRRDIRCRVKAQARDDGVSMAVARVNGDPFAATALAEITKLGRIDWRPEQTGRAERVRNCARTIVPAIGERFVAAAENVGFAMKLIRRPDGPLHCQWRAFRR